MLLTITTSHKPATDLGFLLHKNPNELQSFDLSFGKAQVFYPEASADRCTIVLHLDVDPVGLVRRKDNSSNNFALAQYVNDRPYVASSFLSTSISKLFGSALNGKSKERPELADKKIDLKSSFGAISCKKGADFIRQLFEPLGYKVEISSTDLDEKFPEWGKSPYFIVNLEGTQRLQDLLAHLYVLIPVIDNRKHYFIGDEEIEKLLRHGEGWLQTHPLKEEITRSYLKHQRSLIYEALERLTVEDDPQEDQKLQSFTSQEDALEKTISLKEQRIESILNVLRRHQVKKVIDLGCGEGNLLRVLLEDKSFQEIVGMDVSYRSLERAKKRLRFDQMAPMQKARIRLFQGSLSYRDKRLNDFDAATVIEVIEHLDLPRLANFERVLFEFAKPKLVVVTTPNSEYNVKFPNLKAGHFRHNDHRFEWTRKEFQDWVKHIEEKFQYVSAISPIGDNDAHVGSPTQMAVFTRG